MYAQRQSESRRSNGAITIFVSCGSYSSWLFFWGNGASSRTTLPPLTEDKMCGIVSSKALKDNLSLNVVRYGYENSSQSGMYSCILWSSSGTSVQHSMTIELMPTKAKQLSDITDEYSSYSQLSFEGKEGGQGWVERDYTTMIWIYPDGTT